jgi:hypothetical protein
MATLSALSVVAILAVVVVVVWPLRLGVALPRGVPAAANEPNHPVRTKLPPTFSPSLSIPGEFIVKYLST